MTLDQKYATEATDLLNFNMWMRQVNRIVGEIAGVSVYDLPDALFCDWFESGTGSRAAAKRTLKNAGW